jgi:hypothetical protein
LSSTGNVTQSNLISAAGLELLGLTGAYTLTNTGNSITTLAANTGSLSFLENSGFTVGTVNTVGITTTGNVSLSSAGTITQASDINVGVANVSLTTTGAVTQTTGAILASGLELLGSGGTHTLTNTGNAITTLAGNTGVVSLVENSGFAIGVVNTTGLTTSGNTTLNSTATVTQTEKIAASGLELLGTNGIYTLTNTSNAITTLAANTGTITFLENSGFTVGTVNSVGMTTTNNLILSSTGGITFSKNITSGAGTQTYTGPITLSSQTIELTSTNRDITFAGSTSTINGYQHLTINAGSGSVGFNGIIGATTNPGTLTVTSSSAININANITAASQIYNGPVVIGADVTLIAMGVPTTTTYTDPSVTTSLTIGGYLDSMPVSFALTGAAGGVGGTGNQITQTYSGGVWNSASSSATGSSSSASGTLSAEYSLAAGTSLQLAPGDGGAAGGSSASGSVGGSGGAGGANLISGSGVTGASGSYSYSWVGSNSYPKYYGYGGGGGGGGAASVLRIGSSSTLVAAGANGGAGNSSYASGGAGGLGGGTTGYTGVAPSSYSSGTTTLANSADGSIAVTQQAGGEITFAGSLNGSSAVIRTTLLKE